MLLRRVDFSVDMDGHSVVGMLTVREGRGDEKEIDRDVGFAVFIESSMMLDDGARARDLSPGRGLGVMEGVGRPFTAVTRFSGVRDKGRRLRLAGR